MIVSLVVGDVIVSRGRRLVVMGGPDGVTLRRDHRGRVAVRNLKTGRVSYLPIWRLTEAEHAPEDR